MALGKSLLQNKVTLLFICAIIAFTITSHFYPTNKKNTVKNSAPTIRLDPKKLQEGDLIFRKGHDLLSNLVLSQGNHAQFSHVGIIINNNEIVSVAHSIPKEFTLVSGVQTETLNSFISSDKASEIAIYRLKGIDAKLKYKIKHYLLQQIGKPFDTDFLFSTDDSMYCTELVIKAFAAAGIELPPLHSAIKIMLIDERVVPPDSLRHSHLLERLNNGDTTSTALLK